MFDNPLDILVLVVVLLGWGIFFYLLYGAIKTAVKPEGELKSIRPQPVVPAETKIVPTATTLPSASFPVAEEAANNGVLLSIEVPKENETTPLAAELMFSSLHGIYKSELEKVKGAKQEAISFEIQAQEKAIRALSWHLS